MAQQFSPVRDHIRLMEGRIEQQTAEIERLKLLGQEAAAAERRLFLLRRALDEMRIQLGHLAPAETGAKRVDLDEAMKFLRGREKAS